MGWVSPVGVGSPDGKQVAYNTWDQVSGHDAATPSIRILDTTTGNDSVLASGAFSLAWRRDGAIAYFRGRTKTFTPDNPYVGDIIVRPPGGGPEATWSARPDRYIVAAWAGKTLLAYREGEGEQLDLLAFDGPGKERSLGRNTILVAVSPDGRQALVFDQGAVPTVVRLVDIATGKVLGATDLSSATPEGDVQPQFLGYAGDWTGRYAVADSDVGLVRLKVDGTDITVTDVLAFPRADFPIPPHEPQFVAGSTSKVQAWLPIHSGGTRVNRFLVCDFTSSSCDIGSPDTATAFFEVHNPSRP
jgi:hypothetical protein